VSPDERLDYFRSEFEGKVNRLSKEYAVQFVALVERITALEAKVDKLVREVKGV
jgi:hypothetical protein